MPAIIMFQRYSVENCPMNNEKKKMILYLNDKLSSLLKKHGVKMAGNWSLTQEHLNIIVYEAPTLDAFLKLQKEPVIINWLLDALLKPK